MVGTGNREQGTGESRGPASLALDARLATLDLSFSYRSKPALESICLSLNSGEWLALLGPNGSGKSTLLRLMAGLLKPSKGEVRLEDKPLNAYSSWQRGQRIAFLPQNGGYPEDLTVQEVVNLGRTPHLGLLGRAGKSDLEAVEWAMEQTQVAEFRHRLLPTLSGGERQRVMLARALAGRPQFLLLDEPTNHLDLHHQAEFICLLAGLRTQGIGILTVLHDPNLALQADAVAFLHQGRIVAQGQPEMVLKRELLQQIYGAMVDVKMVDGKPFVLLGVWSHND